MPGFCGPSIAGRIGLDWEVECGDAGPVSPQGHARRAYPEDMNIYWGRKVW